MLLGHCVVPHHHHTDSITNENQHNHSQSGQHRHSEKTPLENAFAGFMHTGEHVSYTNPEETKIVFSKDKTKSTKAFPIDFTTPFEYIIFYQKQTFPSDKRIIYSPPLCSAYTLRGPPPFIVV